MSTETTPIDSLRHLHARCGIARVQNPHDVDDCRALEAAYERLYKAVGPVLAEVDALRAALDAEKARADAAERNLAAERSTREERDRDLFKLRIAYEGAKSNADQATARADALAAGVERAKAVAEQINAECAHVPGEPADANAVWMRRLVAVSLHRVLAALTSTEPGAAPPTTGGTDGPNDGGRATQQARVGDEATTMAQEARDPKGAQAGEARPRVQPAAEVAWVQQVSDPLADLRAAVAAWRDARGPEPMGEQMTPLWRAIAALVNAACALVSATPATGAAGGDVPSLAVSKLREHVEALLILATPTDEDGPAVHEVLSATARFAAVAGCGPLRFVEEARKVFADEQRKAVEAGQIEKPAEAPVGEDVGRYVRAYVGDGSDGLPLGMRVRAGIDRVVAAVRAEERARLGGETIESERRLRFEALAQRDEAVDHLAKIRATLSARPGEIARTAAERVSAELAAERKAHEALVSEVRAALTEPGFGAAIPIVDLARRIRTERDAAFGDASRAEKALREERKAHEGTRIDLGAAKDDRARAAAKGGDRG